MVELNPRPSKPNLFVQVTVAVISGAAVMYMIQNFQASPPALGAAAPAAAPAQPRKFVDVVPMPVEPQPPPVDSSIKPTRYAGPAPAASSMMIVPEEGAATGGVVSVGDDSPAPARAPSASSPDPEDPRAPAVPGRTVPEVHLQKSNLRSRSSGISVGHDFETPRLQARVYARKEAPAAVKAKAKAAAAAEVKTISYARDLAKPIPQKDVFVPSLLHPEILPEREFWDAERKRKVAISALVALAGIGYLLTAFGFINLGSRRVEDDEPAR